jgi:CDP-4-dehydro-6-deoxyglucose reductase, E1
MKSKTIWKLQENIIDQENINSLVNFIKHTKRYTQFTEVKKFEKTWSKWQNTKYSVFVNSGSSANLVILDLLRDLRKWKIGDEIIVPAVTWITDISSVLQLGLKPVFVDINLNDFSFNYEDLAKKITNKTRAIFVTHLIGFPADVKKIKNIVGDRKIDVIEDCCESYGATVKNTKIGNLGLCSSFSFYWGHHMTTVEGGMICCNDEEIYKLAVLKRSHGLARELPKKYHDYLKNLHKDIDFNFLFLTTGFNVRNTEMSAVLGQLQIKNLNKFIRIRNKNHISFLKIIEKFKDYFLLPDNSGISSFCLPLILKDTSLKKPLKDFLTKKGIESRPIISGNLLKQPFLREFVNHEQFPNADFIHSNAFYIGNNQFVNKKRLIYFKNCLKEFFKQKNDK